MAANLNDVLQHADRVILGLETNTRNTLFTDFDFFDQVGGANAQGSINNDILYESNEEILFSNGNIKGAKYHNLLVDGAQIRTGIPEAFTGQGGVSTINVFSIDYKTSSQNLRDKFWDNTEYTLKAGGRLYKGEANDQTLAFSDYALLASGRFKSFSRGGTLELSATRLPDVFNEVFPPDTYDYGQSEGQVKDIIFGTVRNHEPKPLGDGKYQFHAGRFSVNSDPTIDFYPYAGIVDGEIFGDLKPDDSASSGTTYDETDFSFESDSESKISSTVPIATEFSVDSNEVKIVLNEDDDKIYIDQDQVQGGEVIAVETDFTWNRINQKRIRNGSRFPTEVNTNGDVIIWNFSHRWFKITGPATAGKVEFKFDRPVGDVEMIIRNVTGGITVDNWSKEPDTISPAYGADVNSVVTITGVNSDTLSFDFTGNGIFPSGNLVAVWFKSVTSFKPVSVKGSFKFDLPVKDFTLGVEQSGGEVFKSYSVEPTTINTDVDGNITSFVWNDFNSDALELEWDTGRDRMSFEPSSMTMAAGTFGAFVEEGVIRLVPASGQTSGIITRMKSAATGNDTPASRVLSFRARVVGRDSVHLRWGYVALGSVNSIPIEITDTFQDYSFHVDTSFKIGGSLGGGAAVDGLYLATDDLLSPASTGDYSVEIVAYDEHLWQNSINDAYFAVRNKVLNPDSEQVEYLRNFKVDNVDSFGRLPQGISMYDERGITKISDKYRTARGTFDGIKDLSFLDGTDINGDITGIIRDSENRVVIIGNFTTIDGVSRPRIARLREDGGLDTTFVVGTGLNSTPDVVLVQSDDKVIVGGFFNDYNGDTVNRVIRIDTEGALDNTFDTGTGPNARIHGGLVDDDDKVVLVGEFTEFDGPIVADYMVRLTANGAIDSSFWATPIGGSGPGPNAAVHGVIKEGDGYVIFGGFNTVSNVSRDAIAKLDSIGDVLAFSTGGNVDLAAGLINDIAVDDQGAVYFAGNFTYGEGLGVTAYLGKVDSTGAPDTSFNDTMGSPNAEVKGVEWTDQGVTFVGDFTQVGRHNKNRIARIDTDGKVDPGFAEIGGNGDINSLFNEGSGTFLITGDFTEYDGKPYTRVARINSRGTTDLSMAAPVMREMIKLSSGENYVTGTLPEIMEIAFAFNQPKTVKQWIDEICSYTDLIYNFDQETQLLTFTQRYSGEGNPEQFRIYERDIVPESVDRGKTTKSESMYIVEYYDKNNPDSTEVDSVSSDRMPSTEKDPKTFSSMVVNRDDAQYLADRIVRDGQGASEYTLDVRGIHHDFVEGQVGYIYSDDMTSGAAAEILEITKDTETRNTNLRVNLYDIRRDLL